jgi:curved DNA-binding protein CbpA
MTPADDGGPAPDLYQLLGVSREASHQEIALAWRRRARDEHPDARPGDPGAPGRFRALAGAWQVLGDPARRAAYDRARPSPVPAIVRIPVRRPSGPGRAGGITPLAPVAEPPLRAGPVRVESARGAPPADDWDEEGLRLTVLAELARYLARDRGRPW